jgi:hypothetical protein
VPLPRVTGVVWWRMGISHYKAVFRRAAASEEQRGYTKDFLQSPTSMSDVFRTMFGGPPPYEPITYRWPGGIFEGGRIYAAADYNHAQHRGRLEVGQWTAEGAPAPWQVGDPTADPVITVPGDPLARIPDDADAQWEQIEPLQPWLMMVQLDDSTTELHLRAYLGQPTTDLLAADLGQVPESIRLQMGGQGGIAGDDAPPLWFDPDDLRDPWRLAPEARGRAAAAVSSGSEARADSGSWGTGYRRANEEVSTAEPEPFSVDPDERDRSTRAHAVTQNAVADAVEARGLQPLSPSGEPAFDVAWIEPDGTLIVVEVKSINARNEEKQLRLALGQVLRYSDLLLTQDRAVRGAIVTSARVRDRRWHELCDRLEIGLFAADDVVTELEAWNDAA